MRAGVRLGLQSLWICLWWIGRFDSDTLPPVFPLHASSPDTQTVSRFEGSQAPGADRGRRPATRAPRGKSEAEAAETQEARRGVRSGRGIGWTAWGAKRSVGRKEDS